VLLLALLYVVYIFIQIVQRGISVPGYFTLISAVLIIGGIQLICLGIIGEYIGRIYFETKKRPHYIVKKSNVVDDSNVFKKYGKSVPFVFEHGDSIPEKELVVERKTSNTTK